VGKKGKHNTDDIKTGNWAWFLCRLCRFVNLNNLNGKFMRIHVFNI